MTARAVLHGTPNVHIVGNVLDADNAKSVWDGATTVTLDPKRLEYVPG